VPAHGKYGLRMARERAVHLGGQLTVSDNGQRGVQLTLILPKPFSAA
jgi:signal transduction histidine kinase